MNLLNSYDKFAIQFPGNAAVQSLREKGVQYLLAKGLPSRKDEDWKYTSLKILNEEIFLPLALENVQLSHETLQALREKLNPDFINIVFHNGVLNKTLSSIESLPKGVHLQETEDISVADQPSGKDLALFEDSFEALSAAYFVRGYTLKVAPEINVEKPVNFVFYTSPQDRDPALMVHPRIVVEVGSRSNLQFIESYYGQHDAHYFVNAHIEAVVKESAKLVYVRIQHESLSAVNVSRTHFSMGQASHLHSLVLSTGAVLSRHNLVLDLKSPEAFAIVDGVYVVRGRQHVDNTTVIDHKVGACNTSQHYKGILADQSRAVFNGKVAIQRGAQKANSEQLNNNLLLSREAEADSKPQLEIYADDVKAAHGSTVGQLDREELFYLESRAIAPEVAIPMISFGYASELIYKLENEELQKWLNKELRDAFKGIQVGLN